MKVSVLIPTRNRRRYLEEALDSARAQTHGDLEILVSDDGSADATRKYVRGVQRDDGRVRLLTDNPTPGIFTNMWHLVQASTGEAFCLLGDDDRLAPTCIARLVAALERDQRVVLSFCDHGVIDADGTYMQSWSERHSHRYGRAELREGLVEDARTVAYRQSMCFGFALFRSSVFKREPFDLSCESAADLDYMLRATALGRVYYVAERLGDYRDHGGAATRHGDMNAALGVLRVVFKHPPESAEQLRLSRGLLARGNWGAARLLCGNDRVRTVGYLSKYLVATGVPGVPRAGALFLLNLLPGRWAQGARGWVEGIRHRIVLAR